MLLAVLGGERGDFVLHVHVCGTADDRAREPSDADADDSPVHGPRCDAVSVFKADLWLHGGLLYEQPWRLTYLEVEPVHTENVHDDGEMDRPQVTVCSPIKGAWEIPALKQLDLGKHSRCTCTR